MKRLTNEEWFCNIKGIKANLPLPQAPSNFGVDFLIALILSGKRVEGGGKLAQIPLIGNNLSVKIHFVKFKEFCFV